MFALAFFICGAQMRRAAKKDTNHNDIASAFQKLGWSWKDTHQLGGDFPDGIAGIGDHVNILVEIKDGNKPKNARKLSIGQAKFHDEWRGPIFKVETIEDVLQIHSHYMTERTRVENRA